MSQLQLGEYMDDSGDLIGETILIARDGPESPVDDLIEANFFERFPSIVEGKEVYCDPEFVQRLPDASVVYVFSISNHQTGEDVPGFEDDFSNFGAQATVEDEVMFGGPEVRKMLYVRVESGMQLEFPG